MASFTDAFDALDLLVTDQTDTDSAAESEVLLPPLLPPPVTLNVFVYGSLLSGSDDLFYNHSSYLQPRDSESYAVKVCDATTASSSYVMLSQVYKSYPYVVQACDLAVSQGLGLATGVTPCSIQGEVWKVNAHVLAQLDLLEGHPSHYCRKEVPVVVTGSMRLAASAPTVNVMSPVMSPNAPSIGLLREQRKASLSPKPPSSSSPIKLSGSLSPPMVSPTRRRHGALSPKKTLPHSPSLSPTVMMVHMYLLSSKVHIDTFATALKDGPGDEVSEVTPLGDWRSHRQRSYE